MYITSDILPGHIGIFALLPVSLKQYSVELFHSYLVFVYKKRLSELSLYKYHICSLTSLKQDTCLGFQLKFQSAVFDRHQTEIYSVLNVWLTVLTAVC